MPHFHLLVWVQDKVRPKDIDTVILSELFYKQKDHVLYDIVQKIMIHRPCGRLNVKALWMKDGKCIKAFPKDIL